MKKPLVLIALGCQPGNEAYEANTEEAFTTQTEGTWVSDACTESADQST